MKRTLSSTLFIVFIILALLTPSVAHAADIKITMDGRLIYTDVPPIIVNGRVLVPVKNIFDALGGSVEWDSVNNQVYGSRGAHKIWLTIGNIVAYKGNHDPVALDVPAQIIDGRTMVPLRFIAESLGCNVDWDPVNMVVSITSQETSSAEDVFNLVKSSLVEIKKGDSLGSGFFFSNEGEIITNVHVISGTGDIEITTYNNKSYKADIKSLDPIEDIAILKLDNTNDTFRPIYSYKTFNTLQVGQDVISIGNPFGFENSVSTGIISGIRTIDDVNQIQMTAPVSPGNSGSPLLTTDGDVIGITTSSIEEAQNLNFAIPIDAYFSLKSNPPKEDKNEIARFQTNDKEWEISLNQINMDADDALIQIQTGDESGFMTSQGQVIAEIDTLRSSVSSYTTTSPDVKYCLDLYIKCLNDYYDGNKEMESGMLNNDTSMVEDATQKLSDGDDYLNEYDHYKNNVFCILLLDQ